MKGLEKTGNASSVNTINMQASKIAKALFLKDGIIFLPNALAMRVGGGFHDAVMDRLNLSTNGKKKESDLTPEENAHRLRIYNLYCDPIRKQLSIRRNNYGTAFGTAFTRTYFCS